MVEAPTLDKLKSEPCTPEELQAALVKVIELHNKFSQELTDHLNDLKRSGRIRSGIEAFENTRYGL